jgi:4-amino-4-deoxy-L-arabinose transferase-like glycosyltransferase
MTLLFLNSHFTVFQYLTLYGGAFIAVCAVIAWHGYRKYKLGLLLLIGSALLLRFGMIHFDHFLHLWDERFHALVARNLIDNPLKPVLYQNPLLPYNPDVWVLNHVWLHKPPFFLWQMALSMKLFGINEFALRYPSALMSVLMLILIFKMGKTILNKHIAFYAGLMYVCCSYILELTAGYYPTDHNDVAFVFYVTASVWIWTQYIIHKQMRFVILTGIFAGLAVMTKWLPGLVVYSAWATAILFTPNLRNYSKSYLHLGLSLCIAILVFMPWQVYTYLQFSTEFAFTSFKKAEHFFKIIEGHEGTIWYHFLILDKIYAYGVKLLIVPAIILLYRRLKKREFKVGLIALFLTTLIFYSIAKTKMPAFTLISSSVVFLALGTLVYELFLLFKPRYHYLRKVGRTSVIVLLTGCIFWFLDIDTIQKYHTGWKSGYSHYRDAQFESAQKLKAIAKLHLPENTVVINCHEYEAVMCMFYTGFTAYDYFPERIDILIQQKLPILVLNDGNIPEVLISYPYCFVYDRIKKNQ